MAPGCPACGRPVKGRTVAPCQCVVPCRCSPCKDGPNGRCDGSARGWVPSQARKWTWHSCCVRCEKKRCIHGPSSAVVQPLPQEPFIASFAPGAPCLFGYSDGEQWHHQTGAPDTGEAALPSASSSANPKVSLRNALHHAGVGCRISLQQLSAHPINLHRRRRDAEGGMMFERCRGVGKPLAPCGLAIFTPQAGAQGQEEAGVFVVHMVVMRGIGRLHVMPVAGEGAREAIRVAYSLAMLLEKDLARALGPRGLELSLRSQQYDVDTVASLFGLRVRGGSLGVASLLGLVQAMTECAYFDHMSMTGAISLTGRVLRVDSIPEKTKGAVAAGQRAMLLPSGNEVDVQDMLRPRRPRGAPPPQPPPLEYHFVSDVAEALREAVVGWQRRSLLPLPSRDAASMVLPMTMDGRDWLMEIEAAVVPGHGEVHITGVGELGSMITESLRSAVVWARSFQDDIVRQIRSVVPDEVSGRVQLAVDLINMRYTPHHPWAADALRPALDGSGRLVIPHRTLDLHIHLPTTSVVEGEIGYSAALGVLLASLITGVPVAPNVTVVGACRHSGLLGVIYSDSNQRLWQMAEQMGVGRLVLNHEDYDQSQDPQYGGPTDMTRVPTVRVETMMQAITAVFGP